MTVTLNGVDPRHQVAEELRKTLGTLFRPNQLIELRIFGEKKNQIDSGYFTDHEKLIAAALKYDGSSPQYVTVNEIHDGLIALYNNKVHQWANKTTSDKDVLTRRWLPFEFDPDRPSGIPSNDAEYHEAHARAQACREWLRSQGWPDPVYGDSGNGAWLLYPLDNLAVTDDVEHILKACCAVIGARFSGGTPSVKVDETVYNASRIVRLFGTRNLKGDGDKASGRVHRPSGILDDDHGEPMSLEALQAFVNAHSSQPAVQKATKKARKKTDKPTGSWTKESIAGVIERHSDRLSILEDGEYEGGYKWLLEACPFDDSHRDRSAVIILGEGGTFGFRCQHNSCSGKNGQALLSLLGEAATNDPRPRIPVRDLDILKIAPAAWEALCASSHSLYRRDGVLYELTHDDEGSPILRDVNRPILRGYLARVALFVESREKQNKTIEWLVEPPSVILDDMLVNIDERIPMITRITRCPIVMPDGEIILTPGYHAGAHIYYAPRPGVEIPAIPAEPTKTEMLVARSLILDDLLYDFPFVSQADRAHAVAMMLLPYIRDSIRGPTPLHLVEAPNAGSGKGELVRATLTPAFGPLRETPEQPNDNEWKKRLLADLLDMPSLIYCDNINRPIDSGSLALAVTSTIFSDRLLGVNRMAHAPVRCMWVMTGNNPTMSGEIARRSIRIRIDPKMDRPQLREGFKHNIRQWVYEHQGELVAAALTLIRYGLQAERRKPRITLGSFEEWSTLLHQILDACSIPGFLGNLLELYDRADTEGAAWRAFVATWWEKCGDGLVPVGELFDLFKEGDYELNLKGHDDKAQRVAFGKALKKQQDRVIGEHQVVFHGVAHKTNVWKLVPIKKGGDGGDGGDILTQPTHIRVEIDTGMAGAHTRVEEVEVMKPPQPPQPPPTPQQVLEPVVTLAPGVDQPRIEPETIAIDRSRLQELVDGGLSLVEAQRQAIEEAREFEDLARRYEVGRGAPLNRDIWTIPEELPELRAAVAAIERAAAA